MNEELSKNLLKTGTSIVGIVCKDGVVLAADKQTSYGEHMVGHKDTLKIKQVNDYLVLAEAGLVSDVQLMIKVVRAQLRLKELQSKQRPSVRESANLMATNVYQNIRKFSPIPGITAFLVAGINSDGTFGLFSLDPSGAITTLKDYFANGSGMTFLLGVLEKGFKKDMSVKEGIDLAIDCIKSSTQRDVASGFGVDVFTVTKEGIKHAVKQTAQLVYKAEK